MSRTKLGFVAGSVAAHALLALPLVATILWPSPILLALIAAVLLYVCYGAIRTIYIFCTLDGRKILKNKKFIAWLADQGYPVLSNFMQVTDSLSTFDRWLVAGHVHVYRDLRLAKRLRRRLLRRIPRRAVYWMAMHITLSGWWIPRYQYAVHTGNHGPRAWLDHLNRQLDAIYH